MNKDDFDRFWTACVPREARASNENIFDDVIKAIDNSEKYKHLTESKLLEQYRERGQKIHELFQLKKRLKKEIDSWSYYEGQIYDEVSVPNLVILLKKIYEGKEKTVRHHYGGRPLGEEK